MTEKPFTSRALFAAAFCFAIIGSSLYFTHAALQGETGIVEKLRLGQEEERLKTELAALEAKRLRMENLTRRLSRESLDLDLLDERARAVLGYARGDEIAIR